MPDPRRAARLQIALLLSAAVLYLLGNASVPLWDRDEPRYAQTSRQMLLSGDWVVPRLLDEVRTAKPIFIYWCQAAAMKLLGVNEFAARLPSATGMLLTLLLLGVVIHRTIGPRRAVWTVFILGSSGLAIAAAKLCITDAPLLLWVTVAQVCLLVIYTRRGDANPYAAWLTPALLWTAIALAGLTKGPVVLGILLTTMTALALLDVGRDQQRTGRWRRSFGWWWHTRPLMGLFIILLICGPWVYLVERRAPGFILTSIGHDVIHRSRTALEGHWGPPGYYLLTIWVTYLPWSLLLPAALASAWTHRASPVHRFCLAAIVGPWVMFEGVQTKLVHYLLPVFPALAFLTADLLVRAARPGPGRQPLAGTIFMRVATGWAVLVALAASAPWIAVRYFSLGVPALVGASLLSAIGLIYGPAVAYQFRRRRPLRAAGLMGAGMMIFVAVLFVTYLSQVPFLQVSPRVARVLQAEGAVDRGDVIMIDYREDSLAFYQGGTIRGVSDKGYLLHTHRGEWPRWIVLTGGVWRAIPPQVQDAFEVIARVRGWWYVKGRIVEVLVIRKKSPFA